MANTKVTSRVLANDAVLTANIADDQVTTAKIADDQITSALVADDLALGGNPTTTTQSAGNNTTRIATTAFVTTAVANIVDSAPSALDTLNELAAALGDDANFSTTVTNSIAAKLPLAGGTMTGDLILGDNVKLEVGSASGGDLQIYHDGSNSYIDDAGTGDLIINATALRPRTDLFVLNNAANNKNQIVAQSGAIKLFYDGSQQLETFSGGIKVNTIGELGNVANDLTIYSSASGHNGLRMHANGILPTDNAGAIIDNNADLGDPSYRFKDLHLSSIAYVGTYLRFGGASNYYIHSDNNNYLRFGTAGSERMRINSSGNLLVGGTVEAAGAQSGISINAADSASNLYVRHANGSSNGSLFAAFTYNTSQIGSISQNGTSQVLYNVSSDARLKEITGSARGLEVINALNPVSFDWKADGQADEGLIAQEVEKIVPNAVSKTEDEYYQMDYSKLVTPLVKAIQEQQEQIETLKKEVEELKGG